MTGPSSRTIEATVNGVGGSGTGLNLTTAEASSAPLPLSSTGVTAAGGAPQLSQPKS